MSLPIDTAATLLEAHPYLLLFPLVLLEGPIATVAAGLLVATGIMSWPVAYAVAVTADLAGATPYRRLGWEYPKRVNVLAEYWLETESPRVVAVIMEADSMAPFGAIRMHWGSPLAQRCSRPWRASRAWRCSGKPCPGRGRIAARGPGSRAWPLCFLPSLGAARCTCPFRGRPCPGPRFLSARGALRTGRSSTPAGAKGSTSGALFVNLGCRFT